VRGGCHGVNVHHADEAGKTKNGEMRPFVVRQMSKWFYDTSTGAATGAARCGFFVGRGFGLLVASYEGIWWTRGFTWFGPPERNALRPWVNRVVLLCLSVQLKSPSVCSSPRPWRLPGPFIAQGRAATVRPHGPTGGPEAGRPLRS
jgi:hypothetical protein